MSVDLSFINTRISEIETARELMSKYLDLRKELNDMHGVMDASADIREMDARLDELHKVHAALTRLLTVPDSQPIDIDLWPGILGPDVVFGPKFGT